MAPKNESITKPSVKTPKSDEELREVVRNPNEYDGADPVHAPKDDREVNLSPGRSSKYDAAGPTGRSSDAPVKGEDFEEIDEESTADSGVRASKTTGSKNQGSSNEATGGRW